jgi:ankyrin repeat protein
LLPLIEAIIGDDAERVSRLLYDQPALTGLTISEEVFVASIVHQLYAGDTALHVAAAGFREKIVVQLLAAGADFTARNRRGAQPLHYACDTNHHAPDAQAATITVLLEAGADPNARDKSGTAPLHRAVRTRGSAAVGALLEGGAGPNLRNGNGSTPMRLAQQTTGRGGTGTTEAKAEQATIIQLLLQAGARSEP